MHENCETLAVCNTKGAALRARRAHFASTPSQPDCVSRLKTEQARATFMLVRAGLTITAIGIHCIRDVDSKFIVLLCPQFVL